MGGADAPPEAAREEEAEPGATASSGVTASSLEIPEPLVRPWRLAAGVAFGCAIASKWSGVAGIVTAILLSIMWETTRRRRLGIRPAVWRTLQSEGFGIVISLLLVPAVVYVGSYIVWFAQNGWNLAEWMRLQGAIVSYHAGLNVLDEAGNPIHPYLSEAWKWILLWCSHRPPRRLAGRHSPTMRSRPRAGPSQRRSPRP